MKSSQTFNHTQFHIHHYIQTHSSHIHLVTSLPIHHANFFAIFKTVMYGKKYQLHFSSKPFTFNQQSTQQLHIPLTLSLTFIPLLSNVQLPVHNQFLILTCTFCQSPSLSPRSLSTLPFFDLLLHVFNIYLHFLVASGECAMGFRLPHNLHLQLGTQSLVGFKLENKINPNMLNT